MVLAVRFFYTIFATKFAGRTREKAQFLTELAPQHGFF